MKIVWEAEDIRGGTKVQKNHHAADIYIIAVIKKERQEVVSYHLIIDNANYDISNPMTLDEIINFLNENKFRPLRYIDKKNRLNYKNQDYEN